MGVKNTQEIIACLHNFLAKETRIKEMILFGSAVDESFNEHSDVDIALSLDKPMSLDERLLLTVELEQVLGCRVDVVDLSQAKGLIHYEIMTKGTPLKMELGKLVQEKSRALGFHADFLPLLNAFNKRKINRIING